MTRTAFSCSLLIGSVLASAPALAQPTAPLATPPTAPTSPLSTTSATSSTSSASSGMPAPAAVHEGVTFELAAGLGCTHEDSSTSDINPEAVGIGVGAWVAPQLALMVRVAGITKSDGFYRRYNGVATVGAKYLVGEHAWVGGGLGVGGVAYVISHGENTGDIGIGLDLRAGLTLSKTSAHAIDLSVEVTPVHISDADASSTWFTGIALMLGYQSF